MTTYPPLDLTLREQRIHDAEILDRLTRSPQATSLLAMFDGMRPRWAEDAAERLAIAGMIREAPGPGEMIEATATGRAWLARNWRAA